MTIRDSKEKRWTALGLVSFTMLAAYMMTDLMSPLMDMLKAELNWNADDFGWYMSAYGWFNVGLGMLLIGGLILDRMGIRFTGLVSASLMVVGAIIQYYAISGTFDPENLVFGYKIQVFYAAIGYALFAVGAETAGITVSKVVVRWFKGKEMALAMGLQVGVARIGTFFALVMPLPIARYFQSVTTPILFCLLLLFIGFFTFFIYTFMDKELQKEEKETQSEPEEGFKLSDILLIITNKGFWLIAILCVLFYSCVFPFLKFATSFMIHKFHVPENLAGGIPGMLPFGTLLLTPIFGSIYDKKGKGATIMIIGSALLILVHSIFSIPILNNWIVAIILMVILGIGFSLVPSAMWPSVAKIIPEKQLGSAYALIFFIQNIGLAGVPLLIGKVLEKYCVTSLDNGESGYDYTIPMMIFTGFAILSLIVALLLKRQNNISGYGLEKPNIQEAS